MLTLSKLCKSQEIAVYMLLFNLMANEAAVAE